MPAAGGFFVLATPFKLTVLLRIYTIIRFLGCLIVEIKDHRISASQAATVAAPNARESKNIDLPSRASLIGRIEGGRYGKGPSSLTNEIEPLNSLNAQGDADSDNKIKAAAPTKGPETYRVVLHPSEETLWMELRSLNERLSGGTWSEEEGLEVESKILALTSAPLCLTPDPHASRIANLMLAATAPPSQYATNRTLPHQRHLPPLHPQRLKANKEDSFAAGIDREAQQKLVERRRRQALMRLMEGGWKMATKEKKNSNRTAQAQLPSSISATDDCPFTPTFHRLSFIEKYRAKNNKVNGDTARIGQENTAAKSRTQSGLAVEAPTNVAGFLVNGAKGDEGKGDAACNGPLRKSSNKKRKKQDSEALAAEEKEELTSGTKNKKKKTTGGAASANNQDTFLASGKLKGVNATAGSSAKGVKGKSAKSRKTSDKKDTLDATGDASMMVASPTVVAATQLANVEGNAAGAKSAKRPPSGKKTPVKGSKKSGQDHTQQARQGSGSRQSTATPALRNSQLPTGSPMRQAAASPYGVGTMGTPSPAMSQTCISQNNVGLIDGQGAGLNFANLPFGVGLLQQQQQQQQQPSHQQQQQAAIAMAAQFGLPLGVGLPPGMQLGQGGQTVLNLPFGQPQQQGGSAQQQQQQRNGGLPVFNLGNNLMGNQQQQQESQQQNQPDNGLGSLAGVNLNMNNPHAMAQTVAQLQSHPSFHTLPVPIQQQIMAWQRNNPGGGIGQQSQPQQQQAQQQSQQGAGGGGLGRQSGMFPPGWPMAQR